MSRRQEERLILSRKAARSDPAAKAADIFRLLADAALNDRRGVLATITGLTGSGARAVGTHMAVVETGESAGSFSSGCVEAAIVAEALDVLDEGEARMVRFGQGSPYIDIRLPCGGGMDVLFAPNPASDIISGALARLEARSPAVLRLEPNGSVTLANSGIAPAGWADGQFVVSHAPALRLVLMGHGAEMLAGLDLARSFGAEAEIWSPDEAVVEAGLAAGVRAFRLVSPGEPVALAGDPWTAFLFLFHDHDWEPPLIARALETESFWVGAMGSRTTQAARRAALAAIGVTEERIRRVRGPVGLIPSSRDPATLALSAFAEIVGAYDKAMP